jgi:hypothetical protein
MLKQTQSKIKRQALVACVVALSGQAAFSGEISMGNRPEQMMVSAPRLEKAMPESRIETDAKAVIDAIERQIAEDLKQSIETIFNARARLAASELPTRG